MANSARPQARRGPSGAWRSWNAKPIDPLDVYGLPSKGETRLNDYKTQESYYTKIVERYMKFCATSPDLDEAFSQLSLTDGALTSTSPNDAVATTTTTTTTSRPTKYGPGSKPPLTHHHTSPSPQPLTSPDLPQILLAMRKLRESIRSTSRTDQFAQRAHIFILHASILVQSWESYLPTLRYLLQKIHPRTPLSPPELQECIGYRILDLACRQNDLMEATKVRWEFGHRDRRVGVVVRSLVQGDWVRFWRVRRVVDGYQRALMEFAGREMRLHALKCLGKSYMHADKAFVERSGDATWEDLVQGGVGWILQEDGKVVIRKPKPKG